MGIARNIRKIFAVPSRQDRENAYLSRAVSLTDLERREREIDNGLFARRSTML